MNARRAVTSWDPREGDPRVYTVGEIVSELSELISGQYRSVIVQGEISGISPPGKHIYFRLKDANAQLKVAFFESKIRRCPVKLGNGMAVQVEGELGVYAERGEMQLYAERVFPAGYGRLQAQFEALKRKLEAEGLFSTDRKRPLPPYPTRIALVTSPSGAAIHDILRILRQRAPYLLITVVPTRVQGLGAAQEIAAAIELLNQWGEVDVAIVGRGGGSLEDLWAFNEEDVVRAIVGSRIPIVSAVGHEGDVTLSDLAADLRAATPSHAAQEIVRTKEATCTSISELTRHARARLAREIADYRRRLSALATHHALREPHRKHQQVVQALDRRHEALIRAMATSLISRRQLVGRLEQQSLPFSPQERVRRHRDSIAMCADRLARAPNLILHNRNQQVGELGTRLRRASVTELYRKRETLLHTAAKLPLVTPSRRMRLDRERLSDALRRSLQSVNRSIAESRTGLANSRRLLSAYDYHDALRRGFALIWNASGNVLLKRASDVREEQGVMIEFHDARLTARAQPLKRPSEEQRE